jgi:uncharacterized protein YodC (DUF2158 family)
VPDHVTVDEFRKMSVQQRLQAMGLPGALIQSDDELGGIQEGLAAAAAAAAPERPFDVGDIVQLKSGGHRMVVTELRCSRIVALAWSEHHAFVDGEMPEQCLRRAREDDGDLNINNGGLAIPF